MVGTQACRAARSCELFRCEPTLGCVYTQIDEDLDGWGLRTDPTCGEDCHDADPSIHPGAVERCNSIDDDCDGRTDEGAAPGPCYLDRDGDTYGDPATMTLACTCPAGSVPRAGDCLDRPDTVAMQVSPAQSAFFPAPYCRSATACSFDYDCNGTEERQLTTVFSGCRFRVIGATCSGDGWAGGVPACGVEATYVDCTVGVGLGGALLCNERRTMQRQACR
jgi:hypothetical protein